MMLDNNNINSFHRINVILWMAIISSIVMISIVVFIIDKIKIVPLAAADPNAEKILFILAIALAIVIIIFKRSIFLPGNMVNRVIYRYEPDRITILFQKIRQSYLIVWVLGEFICIIGFIDYLFFLRINSYLVYLTVSLYSVIINIPKIEKVEKCLELLKNQQ